MVRQLQPWYENIGKRQVKAPKIYFRDTGLLHSLLDIPDKSSLFGNPKSGASWEGFALEQILQVVRPSQAWYWGVHGRAELDFLFTSKGKRYGVEIKFSEAPSVTTSMRTAIEDLSLKQLWIVYPGKHTTEIDKKISLLPITEIEAIKTVA